MRYIFFVFACMLTFASRAQADKNPYQVLDCSNTVDENGLPVKRFELIGPQQKLRIGENGYCVLIHCTGQSFELQGDTIIAIKDLRVYSSCGSSEFPERPNLKELFDPTMSLTVWSRDRLAILIPPRGSNFVLGINDDLCLQWEPYNGAKGYIVEVSSVEGTSLLPDMHVNDNKVTISHSQIPKAYLADQTILVRVFLEDKKIVVTSTAILVDWKKTNRNFFSCPTSAFQMLMIAYYLERNYLPFYAGKFYERAIKNSSQPVYKELQEKFQGRLNNR